MSSNLANQTMAQKSQTALRSTVGVLRRACDCGQHTIAGAECQECGKQRLQRSAVSQAAAPPRVPSIVNDVLRSPGLSSQLESDKEPLVSRHLQKCVLREAY